MSAVPPFLLPEYANPHGYGQIDKNHSGTFTPVTGRPGAPSSLQAGSALRLQSYLPPFLLRPPFSLRAILSARISWCTPLLLSLCHNVPGKSQAFLFPRAMNAVPARAFGECREVQIPRSLQRGIDLLFPLCLSFASHFIYHNEFFRVCQVGFCHLPIYPFPQ